MISFSIELILYFGKILDQDHSACAPRIPGWCDTVWGIVVAGRLWASDFIILRVLSFIVEARGINCRVKEQENSIRTFKFLRFDTSAYPQHCRNSPSIVTKGWTAIEVNETSFEITQVGVSKHVSVDQLLTGDFVSSYHTRLYLSLRERNNKIQ